ncbi:uncharacterized protein LOC100680164 [Nasonia vitripennis]|uniref:SCP domain-containing protein n=1 Tax=Nasonia vitripennis TaxID=7425 RepID=A0A7M7TA89_NASVI|nr:uncharacterized protein LOC100680164 [Nasonia vitripennis]
MNGNLCPVLVIVAVAFVNFSSAADYCNIKSCNGKAHTACTYQSTKPSSRCGAYQGSGLTQLERTNILNLHNQLRRKVASGNEKRGKPGPQPAAKSMPKMEWDNELATVAQRWANQCTWGHDSCRDVPRFKVGQNIAYKGTTGSVSSINVLTMVNTWYNEVKDFNKNEVKSFNNGNGPMIGHYTQMLWANSTKLGCGAMKYKVGKFNKFYLVCNYGPAGNTWNQPVYQTLYFKYISISDYAIPMYRQLCAKMVRKGLVQLFVIVLVLVGFSRAEINEYCKLRTCRGLPHTACTYSSALSSFFSGRSKNIIKSGLTNEEKQKVVDLHNELRQKVAKGQETKGSPGPQPPAKHMPDLEWDDELANLAQKWANQCKFAHDTCRDVKRFKVGQNIATIGTTGDVDSLKLEDLVLMWYNEVEHFDKNNVGRFSGRGANGNAVGHYTQILWAQTTKIGCGAVKYKDGDFNRFFLVCNYGPAGNYIGEPMYETE